jgi:uncharacterized membrane protein
MIFLLPFMLYILCGWKKQPAVNSIIWLAMVVFSWLLVYLSINHIWERATYYGMYFLYLIWLAAFLLPRRGPEKAVLLPGE